MKKSTEYFKTWRGKLAPEKVEKLRGQRRAAYNKWLKKLKEDPEKAAAEKVRHRAIAKKSFRKRMIENPEKIRARGRAKYAKEKALNSEWYQRKLKYAREYRALQKALNAGEALNG